MNSNCVEPQQHFDDLTDNPYSVSLARTAPVWPKWWPQSIENITTSSKYGEEKSLAPVAKWV